MNKTTLRIATLGFALASCIPAAQADIIQQTPNMGLTNTPYTFQIGNSAQYTFKATPQTTTQTGVALTTGDSAQVSGSDVFGYQYINKYAAGDQINQAGDDFIGITPSGTYADVPTANNADSPFIGLKFMLDGATHYGYAKLDLGGNTPILANYAYSSVAGSNITAGAGSTAAPVSAPGALGLFGLAVLGLSCVTGQGRRTRRALFRFIARRKPRFATSYA